MYGLLFYLLGVSPSIPTGALQIFSRAARVHKGIPRLGEEDSGGQGTDPSELLLDYS